VRPLLLLLALLAAGCGAAANHASTSASLTVPLPERHGHWTRLLLSNDGLTYLGQWSGECEIQTAYLVPARGGRPRPITNYARGSAQSVALGWVGRRARVRLPQGQPPSRAPGVYLVDPKTMAMTLERRLALARAC
jgi:hypothetical protein